MSLDEFEAALVRTLEDHRLSRAERQALLPAIEPLRDSVGRPELRRTALNVARAALRDPADREVVDWLEGVLKLIDRPDEDAEGRPSAPEAYFSPGDECRRRIVGLLDGAKTSVDVCVFTITDDRISDAIVAAHRRGVAVRIVTDDGKSVDEGSDIGRFERSGIPVRVDRTEYHMHHKFALFDGSRLLSGSYNWTRGAALYNDENLIVTADRRLISAFGRTFERLWEKLG